MNERKYNITYEAWHNVAKEHKILKVKFLKIKNF